MEDKVRGLRGWISGLAIVACLFHVVAFSGLLTILRIFIPTSQLRAVSLILVLSLVYLELIVQAKNRRHQLVFLLLLVVGITGSALPVLSYQRYISYSLIGYLDSTGLLAISLLSVSLLCAAKWRLGWAIPLIIVTISAITLFQPALPGLIRGPATAPDRFGYTIFVGTSGIFGVPFRVATSIIISFLIFGALFEASGGGRWFVDLAMRTTGRMTGGPAKAAVVSSALFGMLSGSPSSNVATTGVLTIPLMRRMGFNSSLAGAVETVASTGGMIMPPVMGAVTFVMAEWLGIPYAQVAFMALIPALCYYTVLFASVHFAACREGLKYSAEELPDVKGILREGWFYVIPLAFLVYFLLVAKLPPSTSAIATLPLVVVVSFLSKNKTNHLVPRKILNALKESMWRWLTIGLITAIVGIVLGSLELSGLGVRISGFLVDLARGNLLLTMIMVATSSFVLGMGLDALPCYITLAILTAPALVKLGVPLIAAHFFVLYWGLSSFITPPVCLAVYTACSITGGNVWKTGWDSVKVGIIVFIIPFAFVYHPSLLLMGTGKEILLAAGTALIGGVIMAGAIQGCFFFGRKLGLVSRFALFLSGFMLIIANSIQMLSLAAALTLFGVLWQIGEGKRHNGEHVQVPVLSRRKGGLP
jgi:TRAP transporter 4TM/12TM fusion protein